MRVIRNYIILVLILVITSFAVAEDRLPVKPGPKDRCPVCGMFVAKYTTFLAVISFSDGSHQFFDGTRDMFVFYLRLQEKDPERFQAIESVLVTDYYMLDMIDGTGAWYVTGSDVYGPMGAELIAFKNEDGAREFRKDHKGESILRFREVNEEILDGLK